MFMNSKGLQYSLRPRKTSEEIVMRLPVHYSHLLRDEALCVGGISIWLLVVGRIPLLKRSVALMSVVVDEVI